MKISLNWLKEYIDVDKSPEEIGEILTDIGLEVEGMEEIESIKGGLEGVVVGHVMECAKHPNADKLSLSKVDVAGEAQLQIVCGAPNIKVGQKVLVATIGTTLYSPEGEPWKIKKGKIRGEESQGMICAEDELGLGASHEGIMVLPEEVATGTLAKDYFKVEKDYVYDIGLTPNRSDATSHLGVAGDLAAALKINYKTGDGKVSRPDVSTFESLKTGAPIEVVVENAKACPRFSGVTIKNLEHKQAPDWMKKKLAAIGVKSINAVVDITNFILHETGQPLHAYDLNKITGKKILVKNLPAGTEFKTLDDKVIKLRAEDLIICDGDSKGMCIAGVYGGLDSGVTDDTKDIFLEAAHFDQISIRQTSTKHFLRTDAAKVFEKGSDPAKTVFALKRAAMLLQELAGGEIASEIVDIYPEKILPREITVKYNHVTRLVGTDIPKEEIKEILEALPNTKVVSEDTDSFVVSIPTDKFDVLREADVIEEIIRIYGLNKVPIPSKINTSIATDKPIQPLKIKDKLSSLLVGNGFNEIMAVSLTRSTYYTEILNYEKESLVFVNNTSNRDFDIMRPTMLFSMLEAIVHNQNRKNSDLSLFEFGSVYFNKGSEIQEERVLSIAITGQDTGESWLNSTKNEVSFYSLKSYIHLLLEHFGINAYQKAESDEDVLLYGMKYFRGPMRVAEFGKVKTQITSKMGIKNEVFYATLYLDDIFKAIQKQKVKFVELNKFPGSRRDLALVIDQGVKFGEIEAIAKKTEKKYLKGINLFDVYTNEEQLGKGKKSYAVSFNFENPERTMKDKEVDKIMSTLIAKYETELKAVIRR